MPAVENTGTLIHTPRGYFAQFSIGRSRRKRAMLRTCTTNEEAARRQLAIAKLVARLRETGYTSMVANTIRDAAAVDDEGPRCRSGSSEPRTPGRGTGHGWNTGTFPNRA